MRAIVKATRGPGLILQDVPLPDVGPNDVLIRIKRSSICGTDLHIEAWDDWAARNVPVPMPIGHEFMGEVAAKGAAVTGVEVGDRVTGEGHVICGQCRNCRAGKRHLCRNAQGIGVQRPGAFAEYLCLPAFNVFPLHADIPDDLGSVFDPLGNAIHAALSFDLVGEDVIITGAGPIGCMAAAVCRHVGARHIVITDVNPYRLRLALRLGATRAVDVRAERLADVMASLGMKEGFDVGLELSGIPTAICNLIEAMNHGGRVALLGIPQSDVTVDWSSLIFKGLMVKGIYGREMFETWYKMAALVRTGLDVAPVITHRFPAEAFGDAFAAVRSGESGKAVLSWD